MLAAPWLWQALVPVGLIGVAMGLTLVAGRHGWRMELAVLAATTLAITLAFHWTPHALAGAMRASPIVGLAFSVPLILWDASRFALPFWAAGRLARDPRVAWFPAAVTAVVAERVMPGVFPWKFGYSQLGWPVTAQSAALVGAEGPTFTLFAAGGALVVAASLARRTSARPLPPLAWVAVAVTAANLLYGVAALRAVDAEAEAAAKIRLALVQADPDADGGIDALRRMTAEVMKSKPAPDLVVWPECSGGSYDESLDSLADETKVFQKSRDPHRGLRPFPEPSCPILLGGRIYQGFRERPEKIFQAALLVDTNERLAGRYFKRHLMPFGEYVPWADVVSELRLWFPLETSFDRGDQAAVIVTGQARIGPLLCYEDMVPSAAASAVAESANILVVLAHGAAFSSAVTLRQHRLLAQCRAIENRRCLVRCGSTGETCVIDAAGRIVARLPLGIEETLVAEVPLLDGKAISNTLGPVLPVGCGIALLALIVGKLRKREALADPTTPG